jgi:hypothetical protein
VVAWYELWKLLTEKQHLALQELGKLEWIFKHFAHFSGFMLYSTVHNVTEQWLLYVITNVTLIKVQSRSYNIYPHRDVFLFPGEWPVQRTLSDMSDSSIIDVVTYKWWVRTNRCTFETVNSPTEELVGIFIENLIKLQTHDFVTHQQSAFIENIV